MRDVLQRMLDPPGSARDPRDVRAISERESSLFRSFIERESGIHLNPAKRSFLVGRLAGRLRELGLESFAEYYEYALHDDPRERVHLIDRISTNETSFFREPRQFELLEQRILPGWSSEALERRRMRRVRAWSAGCSTGEEPYSLAMVLLEHLEAAAGWSVEILATDISSRALQSAQSAIYPIEEAGEIPPKYAKRFMLKGTGAQQGNVKVGPEARSIIEFQRINVNDESHFVQGPFDLILCRNVLIYFEEKRRLLVLHRLLDALAQDGLLLLGHSESLFGRTERARLLSPTVYALARRASLAAR